jgi:polyisoprenoid-binding protein YceI
MFKHSIESTFYLATQNQKNKMKKLNLLAVFVLVAGTAFSQTWTYDKSHSRIGFNITHLMLTDVSGSFKTSEVTVTSSKADFSDAVIEASMDVASINTENENRDNDLKSEKFFDAAKFPKITFKSTSLKKVDGNKYKLAGDLTMKGVTKPVEFDAVLNGPIEQRGKTKIGLKVSGSFKRTDFGVGPSGGTFLSEEIQLMANGEFTKQ